MNTTDDRLQYGRGYPRPQLRREEWTSLDGTWQFAIDENALWARPDEVEVGYRYRRSAWGRGVATEAATPLVQIALADPATAAVVACALAGNAGSLRVLEKLGLERVGAVLLPGTGAPTVKLARVK